ncbi:MAG: beta-lactamase family protein [Candidatus Heimdallarchaeota archaeon]|nr:beta-lactamase family protein [Candidatus Heimdallarchaeota archaeon]MCK4291476.1 beta-lactamase family protein [Candidatus Heimdallarchaeota archaeon]
MKIQVENPKSFDTLTSELHEYIDDNKTGGILCAVYHKGDLVYCNKFGWKDKENNIPMAFDDIFRIYSLTKPIICLAALILLEQQKFDLDDSIEKFLPEFNNLRILKSFDEQTGKIEFIDVKKTLSIKQLFTHTS